MQLNKSQTVVSAYELIDYVKLTDLLALCGCQTSLYSSE
jgi:hypothetical protein